MGWAGLGSINNLSELRTPLLGEGDTNWAGRVYISLASLAPHCQPPPPPPPPPQHQKLCSVTFQSLKMFLPQPSETCQNCNYKVVKFR